MKEECSPTPTKGTTTGMKACDDPVERFQQIYKEKEGKEISRKEAQAQVSKMFDLADLVIDAAIEKQRKDRQKHRN